MHAAVDKVEPIALGPGEGEALWFLGVLSIVKAGGEASGGRFALIEQLAAKGHSPPLHVHSREDEWFYILEGELTVDYGPKGQRTYRKGDGLMEAMNEAHNGRNSGPGPLKILAVVIGAEGVQGSVPESPPARAQ
jgi:mannose-6-phosphate isomerase-like protein (cupin superfamily)